MQFNNTTNTARPPRPTATVSFNAANVTICFIAIILNLIELALIIRKKRIKAFERILLSLSVADILVCVLYCFREFYEFVTNQPLYNTATANLIEFPLEAFSIMTSTTNVLILGIDRLLAVKYPLRHAVWTTKAKTCLLIVSAWVTSIILSLLSNVNGLAGDESVNARKTSASIFSGLLFTSVVGITILYALIVQTVIKRNKAMSQANGSTGMRNNEFVITITCVLVVAAFALCSIPFAIDIITSNTPSLPIKTFLVNTILDPLIYFFKGYVQNKIRNNERNQMGGIKIATVNSSNKPTPQMPRVEQKSEGDRLGSNLMKSAMINHGNNIDVAHGSNEV